MFIVLIMNYLIIAYIQFLVYFYVYRIDEGHEFESQYSQLSMCQ